MSTTMEDRVILLLREQSGEAAPGDAQVAQDGSVPLAGHGFWERLAERTSVMSRRWRKVYAREQRVTSDMLQTLAQLFPSYAFWLATGITDATNGHVAPVTAQTFPERLHAESPAAREYFRASLALMGRIFEEGGVNVLDDRERLYAAERTRPLAHWHDSPLAEAAYRLAQSVDYAAVEVLWREREAERTTRCRRIMSKDRPGARRREEKGASAAVPVLGVDPRTVHQDVWDLFYQPARQLSTKREQ